MLVTIFSVDELDRYEIYINVFSDNAMARNDSLETTFTEVQLANDERRGSLFSDTIIIQNMTPTVFLIVLIIDSDDPETEFTDEQSASGDRYNCVFSYNAITRVDNTETVFVNEQLVNNGDTFFTESQYERHNRYMTVFADYSTAERNNIQTVFTEEELERYARSTTFDGTY